MDKPTAKPLPSGTCPECGGDNRCSGDENCWCMSRPRTLPVPEKGACRCKKCLDAALSGSMPPDRPEA